MAQFDAPSNGWISIARALINFWGKAAFSPQFLLEKPQNLFLSRVDKTGLAKRTSRMDDTGLADTPVHDDLNTGPGTGARGGVPSRAHRLVSSGILRPRRVMTL